MLAQSLRLNCEMAARAVRAVTVLAVLGIGIQGKKVDNSAIAGDLHDLVEMVPCDQLAALFFEYLSSDSQVVSVMQYLTSEKFKNSLVQFETSPSFQEAYDTLAPLGVDLYSLTNEMSRALEGMGRPSRVRRATLRLRHRSARVRRNHPRGLLGLTKEALALIPLQEIKEAYNHKLDTNPQFEHVMEGLLTPEMRHHAYQLLSSSQFDEISRQLAEIGVPTNEIVDILEETFIDFFDLEDEEVEDEADE